MAAYFALTFAISWGGVLLVVGVAPGGGSGTTWQSDPRLPFMGLTMLAGPSVASIGLTGILDGRAGLRRLLTRLTRWRVGARWYAVALLTAPLLFTAVSLALSLISPEFLPIIFTSGDKAALLLSGIAAAIAVGILEELGWTGFAVPRLRLRYGVLTTGLAVGVPWGAWHVLTNGVWASGFTSGGLSPAIFLPAFVLTLLAGQLPAYRVLMVWVYDRTGGSLPVAMLMHASLSASTFILGTLSTGVALLAYSLARPPRGGFSLQWWPWPTAGISRSKRSGNDSGGRWLEGQMILSTAVRLFPFPGPGYAPSTPQESSVRALRQLSR